MSLIKEGVTNVFASNVLGDVALFDGLIRACQLKNGAVFVGSEAARGVSKMKIKRPALPQSSVEDFANVIMVLKKTIRHALVRAGITGKVIGWYSFRHSYATNLRSLGVDVKVAQELLRHANSRITMDIYTQAVSAEKHLASGRQIDLLLGKTKGADCSKHPLAPLIKGDHVVTIP